jgi:tetratricopeptide (TPR) repeat protein
MSIRHSVAAAYLLLLLAGSMQAQGESPIKRGTELFKHQDYQLAIKEYQRVSERNRDEYAQAQYNIGVCYYELWRTDDSIVFYKRAIELKGGVYPTASYALGVAYEDQNKLSEAKAAYRSAVRSYAVAIYRLGVVFAKEGDNTSAAECFRVANTKRGPHVPASHNNLGVMLARMGNLNGAEVEFVEALRLAGGQFDDAAYNLKLSRKLRLESQDRVQASAFALFDR